MPPTNPGFTPTFNQNMSPAIPPQNHSVKNTIQNVAAGIFIACVVVLSIIAIFGVWDFFSSDVITKSFETLGLLAFVAMVVIIASNFVGDPSETSVTIQNQGFRAMRNVTLVTLIGSSTILALLGVLSIWEVITDQKVLSKSISSLAIIAFASLIIVILCLEREKNSFWSKRSKEVSGGAIVAAIIFIYILVVFMMR